MKNNDKKFSIIIPAYNEASSVLELHKELISVMQKIDGGYEIIFVDDGSKDNTWQKILNTNAKAIRFTKNFGKSQALQAGFDKAKGNLIITIDADLQDHPQEIPRLINKIEEGYDLVAGWKHKRKDPVHKKFTSYLANKITNGITGTNIHDMNCGLKIYRSEVCKELKLHGELHRFIPALAHTMGYKVGEMKVNHRNRKYGNSKYGTKRLITSLFDFISVLFFQYFIDRPMYLFGSLGLLSTFIGGITLMYLTSLKVLYGATIGNRPLLLLGILLMIIGIQFFSLGLISEIIIQKDKSSKDLYTISDSKL